MDELDVDTYYGAYTRSVNTRQNAGELRVFALGYIDHRTRVLKTDNRSTPIRTADIGKIEIATWGADYAHVVNTTNTGKFDFLAWGAVQTGSWGNLTQRAGSFVGEAGWQLPLKVLKPWVSGGIFVRQRRRERQGLDSRHVLSSPDDTAPVRALSFLQYDE